MIDYYYYPKIEADQLILKRNICFEFFRGGNTGGLELSLLKLYRFSYFLMSSWLWAVVTSTFGTSSGLTMLVLRKPSERENMVRPTDGAVSRLDLADLLLFIP